jgi:hypothetical protein
MEKTAPKLEPVQEKDGSWHVRLTHPYGRETAIGEFESEAQARAWINDESAGWLQRYEGGRYAQPPARPRDLNQWAKRMVDIATGEVADIEPAPQHDPNKDPAAVALGRKGGLKGGRARSESLTPEERKRIAQNAATKRWRKDD